MEREPEIRLPVRAAKRRMQWSIAIPVGVGLLFGLGLLGLFYLFSRTLGILLLSITIADALSPIARRLQKWMSRTWAVVLIYATLIGLIVLFGWLLAPAIVEQTRDLMARGPSIVDQLQQLIEMGRRFLPDDALKNVGGAMGEWTDRLISVPLTIGSGIVLMVLIFFLSFYWLLAEPDINAFIRSLFPEHRQERVDEVRRKINRAMGGYLAGVTIDGLITGALTWIGLTIVGIEYAFPLAALSALGELFPYAGPIIAAIPGILVALLQSPEKAIWVAGVYLVVQQIEGQILTPNVMRKMTDVPQVLVITALFAGASLGGLLGAIIAVPLAGAIKVFVEEVIAPSIRRWSGAQPYDPENNNAEEEVS